MALDRLADWQRRLLIGGLPAVLDMGSAGGALQGDTMPEREAPEPELKDAQPTDPVPSPDSLLMRVTSPQILTATAVAVGLLGLVYVLRR